MHSIVGFPSRDKQQPHAPAALRMLARDVRHRIPNRGFRPLVLEIASRIGHPCQVPLEPLHATVFQAHGFEERERRPARIGPRYP